MQYEWDPAKNARNNIKHKGVTFELAALVFQDARCLIRPDRIDERGEQRWHAIGAVPLEDGKQFVLLVVHVYRENHHGEEIIRILSARPAEKHELRRYLEQALD